MNFNAVNTIVQLSNFLHLRVDRFYLGNNGIIDTAFDGVELVGCIVKTGCQNLALQDDIVAQYGVAGIGRELLPGVKKSIYISRNIVIRNVKNPFKV